MSADPHKPLAADAPLTVVPCGEVVSVTARGETIYVDVILYSGRCNMNFTYDKGAPAPSPGTRLFFAWQVGR